MHAPATLPDQPGRGKNPDRPASESDELALEWSVDPDSPRETRVVERLTAVQRRDRFRQHRRERTYFERASRRGGDNRVGDDDASQAEPS